MSDTAGWRARLPAKLDEHFYLFFRFFSLKGHPTAHETLRENRKRLRLYRAKICDTRKL